MGCTYNTGQDGEEMTSLGILKNHAYGLLDAREVENNKLISIRNPYIIMTSSCVNTEHELDGVIWNGREDSQIIPLIGLLHSFKHSM
jgi:hypothetical protein